MRKAIAALGLVFAIPAFADESLAWRSDWRTAFEEAREQHKLVFVDYFATWCKPCREMEEKVFPLPAVREQLSHFVLLRIDADKNNIARAQHIDIFPTYGVYDSGERLRFRIAGEHPVPVFLKSLEDIQATAPQFIRAADLFERNEDLEGEFLAANTYSHMGLNADARESYERVRKIAEKHGDKRSAQLADALSAFTFAREGNPKRALALLNALAAAPVDRETAALIWLTIGNVHRVSNDRSAAADAYRRVQTLAAPESATYKDAAAALASLR